MNHRTRVIIASTAAAAVLTGVFMVQPTFAQGPNATKLVNEIATKFNLKPADVQAIFDQHSATEQANRLQQFTDKLNTAVTEGKLTVAQRDLILTKEQDVKTQMESIRAMTNKTERRKAMQKLQAELITWAKDNGIGSQWIPQAKATHRHGKS